MAWSSLPARGRKPKGSERRGKLCNMTNIRDRPEEVAGRLVPGHWEGDLILGAGGASAVGTLVERTTRLVVLVHMPTRKADVAASAFAGALNAIPAPLRKTLTYRPGQGCASKARIIYGGRFHPGSCRLIRKLTSGLVGQPAGSKPRDKGRLGRPSDPTGRNASEVRAGLERVSTALRLSSDRAE